MKKFSNISGYKVNKEHKIEISKENQQIDELKFSIIGLMNQFLKIQSYGSARKNILSTVKITGQDLFVEALMDMLSSQSTKNQIKALESLKSKCKDWESIDQSINELNNNLQEIQNAKNLRNHIFKIKNLIDIYGDDSDNFKFIVEKYCDKIKDPNIAYQRAIAAKLMTENSKFKKYSKEKLLIIYEKFLQKSEQLGYGDSR
jgi:hypothetical protein